MLRETFSTATGVLPTKKNRLYKTIMADIHAMNKDGAVLYPSVEKVKSLVAKGIDVNTIFRPYPAPLETVAGEYGYISQYLQHSSGRAMTNSRKSKKSEDGKYYVPAVTRPVTQDELREYLTRLREISQVLIDAGANPHKAADIMRSTFAWHQKCVETDKKEGCPNFTTAEARERWKPEVIHPELTDYLAQLVTAEKAYDQRAAQPPRPSKKGPRHRLIRPRG